jgi:plastocyanin
MKPCSSVRDYGKELIPVNVVRIGFLLGALTLALALPAPGAMHFVDVEDWRFDADNNDATQVDTLVVSAGDTVQWDWVEGFHTITSGLSSDPGDDPGALFDAPSTQSDPVFQYVFTVEGDVPYFCEPHEGLNMKGVIRVEGGAGIEDESGNSSNLPRSIRLSQNYPNPFNPVTTISFEIVSAGAEASSDVSLEIYDMRGRRVRTLFEGSLPAGSHGMVWDGRADSGEPAGSGIYLYRLRVDSQTATRRMMIAR